MKDRKDSQRIAIHAEIRAFVLLLSLCGLLSSASTVYAQPRAARAMRGVKIERTSAGWILELEFEFALRYLRHSPESPNKSLRIQIDPLEFGGDPVFQGPLRESLPIPRGEPIPLIEIVFDSSIPEEPFVEIQFSQTLEFHVEQSSRLQILKISAEFPMGTAQSSSGHARAKQLLARGRNAIRDGELDLAIALLTRILELPDGESSLQLRMDSRELVAITYERRGQIAHAQAEYEAYLKDYPDGPAADRVRQRLEALLTASDAPRSPLRGTSRTNSKGQGAIRKDLFGSISGRYFRSESLSDEAGGRFLATNFLTDIDIAGRLENERWRVRGDFIGTYDLDVAGEGRSDDARISRLSIQIEDRVHRLQATLGRQRSNDVGVLGRFDGLRVATKLDSHFTLSALVGLPVESTSDAKPNTDTILAAGAIKTDELWLPGLGGQIFAVGRHSAGMTGRAAIGGEARYAGEKSYSFIYFDYDVLFASLNTLLASSTYRPSSNTDFRILIERRNSPVLTLQTALQGQTSEDLNALSKIFSDSQIRDLALDRTAISWSGSIGATHRPTSRYQISGDLTVSHFGKTKTSGGVNGSEAVGPDFGGSLQLVVNDWLIEGGLGSASLRHFEGDSFRSTTTTLYSRFAFPHKLRILPRIRWEWRDSRTQGAVSSLRPSFEIDWRFSSFLFNFEAGINWEEPISGDNASRETSYFLEAGIRWVF